MSVKQDDFTGSHRYNRPKFFGAAVKRKEDAALLTGRGHFVDDIRFPGTLHAAFVRSAHAHAKIRGIDFENVVHARKRDHNAAAAGNRSAGKSRARAAPYHRSLIAICQADDPSHIACGGRKNDAPGRSQLHRAVVFVEH